MSKFSLNIYVLNSNIRVSILDIRVTRKTQILEIIESALHVFWSSLTNLDSFLIPRALTPNIHIMLLSHSGLPLQVTSIPFLILSIRWFPEIGPLLFGSNSEKWQGTLVIVFFEEESFTLCRHFNEWKCTFLFPITTNRTVRLDRFSHQYFSLFFFTDRWIQLQRQPLFHF